MPMNYRQALQLIQQHGGKLECHGRSHDRFRMPWGTIVTVPRHKGDFSPGVENDIKKRATGARKD